MLFAHYDKENSLEQSLLDHSISTGTLARKMGEGVALPNMCFLAGILHDVGKADKNFQKMMVGGSGRKVIHSSAGLKYVLSFLNGDLDTSWEFREYIEVLAYAIGAHHSVFDIPAQDDDMVWTSRLYLKANYNRKKYHYESDVLDFIQELDSSLKKEYGKTIEEFLLDGFHEYQESRKKLELVDDQEEDFYTGLYVRLILSILKNADVLDTINAYGEIVKPISEDQYDQYRDIYLERIEELYQSFGQPKNEINRVRSLGGERAKERGKLDEAGVYRLDLPTGAGKTQISLRYAIHQFKYKEKSRIFYLSPYLSVLEQNAQVIREIVREGVLEYHSNIVEDKEGDENDRESKEYVFGEYLQETWDSPLVATTMVQFANTLFKNRSANLRRFTSLINAVIIMDEVQSLPVNVTYMFNSTMNFMTQVMGATIVHCTATQPNYDSSQIKYPIIYGGKTEADIVSLTESERGVFDRNRIYLMNEGKKVGLEDIVDEISKYPDDSYLVVLNTKTAVKELYDLCENTLDRDIYYLSTNLCPAHRKDIIDNIKKDLDAGEPIVCISTSLIEAGVDLDFNRLIRSYAGIDSLIQAIGRCNREGVLGKNGIVLLAYLDDQIENLKMLKDIKKKKNISRDILEGLDPEDEIDLSKFSKEFFERYFINSENEMYYWVDLRDGRAKLYDLLGSNSEYELDYDQDFILTQSFKEAGQAFELIDDRTRGVIVHYKESSELINELEGLIDDFYQSYDLEDYRKIKDMIKRLQPYTVNMYNLNDLQSSLINLMDGKVLVLYDGNYSDKIGVTTEMDLDSFLL